MNQLKSKAKQLLSCIVSLLTFSAFVWTIGFGLPDTYCTYTGGKLLIGKTKSTSMASAPIDEREEVDSDQHCIPTSVIQYLFDPGSQLEKAMHVAYTTACKRTISIKTPSFIKYRILRI